jgi:Ca-activated chloride channel homolog
VFQENGNDVSSMVKLEDLKLFENKKAKALQAIKKVEDSQQAVMILVDTSSSMERIIELEMKVAGYLAQAILSNPSNHVGVFEIKGDPVEKVKLSNDKDTVLKSISELKVDRVIGASTSERIGGTSLFDTIWDAALALTSASEKRKSIILLSDGIDTTSVKKKSEVRDFIAKSNITIYSIGVGDPNVNGGSFENSVDVTLLRELTEKSGGITYVPKRKEPIKFGIDAILQHLNSPYFIVYKSDLRDEIAELKFDFSNAELKKRKIEFSYPRKIYLSH